MTIFEISFINKEKIEKIKLIKTSNSVYQSSLDDFYNFAASDKCNIEIVEALLSAVESKENIENACDLLEKNGFLKVEIALLKNDLYFECNNTVTGISDNSENLLNVPVK